MLINSIKQKPKPMDSKQFIKLSKEGESSHFLFSITYIKMSPEIDENVLTNQKMSPENDENILTKLKISSENILVKTCK